MEASTYSPIEAVKSLYPMTKEKNRKFVLHLSSMNPDIEVYKWLSEKVPQQINEVYNKKPYWTALHFAALGGDPVIIEKLASAIDINIPDADGNTPLHVAVKSGPITGVTALLRLGADANKRNTFGVTAKDEADARADLQFRSVLERY